VQSPPVQDEKEVEMAISVLPVDGLINRLIQQNQRPTSRPANASADSATLQDKVNISSQAKAHAAGSGEHAPSQLESKLLEMYKAHSGSHS